MIKTVLITGASKGVGAATGRLFAARGWNVVATARTPSALGTWADAENVLKLRLDVTEPEGIGLAIEAAERRFGAIDVLVNNAGGGLGGPIEGVLPAQWLRLFDQNLFGVINTLQAVLPGMRHRKRGLIINVSSVAGRVGIPFLAPYCASKHALEGLSEAMTFELEPFGIGIKLIESGGIRSEFTHEWAKDSDYQPESRQIERKMIAGVKAAKPPEGVAKVIFAAATDGRNRLRYSANGGGALLFVNKLLSSAAFHRLLRKSFYGAPNAVVR